MKLFAQISKIDEEQRMVWGYATTEARDSQGEIVTLDCIKSAWEDYMKFANIREMHQASAAGVVKEYSFDETGVFIGAEIVDDAAWNKVKKQVYKGFSIGGKKLPGGWDPVTKTISAMQLTEISLVDRPANPEALIEMFKMADQPEGNTMSDATGKQPADELLDMISKGAVPADRLLELAQAVAKGVTVTIQVDNQGSNDQGTVNPDAATGGNAASTLTPTPGASATETSNATGTAVSDTEKDPSDPTNANNQLNAPNNPGMTVKGEGKGAVLKAIKALALKGEDVKKGMWSISDLAQLINSLRWLVEDAAWERDGEGDNSTVPEQLASAVQALGAALVDMCNEEIAELIAALPVSTNPLDTLSAVIANSEAAPTLTKWNEAIGVLKAGARNSADDLDRIQKAHDLLAELGAACAAVDKADHNHVGEAAVQKAATGDVAKMAATVEKMASELSTLRGDLQKAHGLIGDLQKQVAKQPTAPKGGLRVVEKGSDLTEGIQGGESESVVDPVLKADGTVDDLATAIKKVHAGGGRLQVGQR